MLKNKVVVAGLLLPLGLAACAVQPVPLSDAEMQALVGADRQAIQEAAVPVTGTLALEDAIALALKNNLDYRTRMLEQSLAAGQIEAGRFDMLPKLLTSAGYTWRSEENVRESIDSVTGAPSLANPSISSDRSHATAQAGLSWSVLDFGVSYYTAKQNADRLLVANERRRKAMHTLIQSVRTTYWRALAAQKLRDQVRVTTRDAEQALADSRRVSAVQVRNPVEPLRYQRNLLENLRLMENVDRELAAAEIELATLIGAPAGTRLRLVEPTALDFKPFTLDAAQMEEVALRNNADLREQVYNTRIAAGETRKAMLKMLPNLSFDYAFKYDGDSYLINNTWQEAGSQVAFNLFNLLSGPAQIRTAEMGEAVAESRRMALQMAVLSQVHLSRHQYEDAVREYRRAVAIHEVDTRLADLARSQERSQMGSGLERISASVTAILSTIRMYHAVAKVNEAASRVQASLGQEPEIGSLDDMTLEELKGRVTSMLSEAI